MSELRLPTPDSSRSDLSENRWLAARFLEGLEAGLDRSQILAALEGEDDQAHDDFEMVLTRVADRLGISLLEVEASIRDLQGKKRSLPALRMGERPLLVRRLSRNSAIVEDGHGERQRVPLNELGKDRREQWVMGSPLLALDSLRGRTPLRRFLQYLRLDLGLTQLVIIYAVGVELLSLAVPLTVQILINTIGFGMLIQPLIVLSVLLLAALAGASLLRVLQIVTVEHMSRRFVQRTVMDFGARLGRLEPNADCPQYPAHRFFEIGTVDKAFFTMGLDLVTLSLQVATATLLLAVYHPMLLGFALTMSLCVALCVRIPFNRALRHSVDESHAKYDLAAWLSGHPQNQPVAQHRLTAHWMSARARGFGVVLKQQVGLFGVQVVFSTLLLLMGGQLVIAGQLTLGQLVAAELVTTAALVSLGKLGKELPKVYDVLASFEKLGLIIDQPMRESKGKA